MITCHTCNDSGWDEMFGSACGDCGASLSTPEAIADAQAAHASALATVAKVQAGRVELVAWLAAQDWEFPQSLAAQYEKKGDLSPKQWAAAEKLFAKATDPAAPPRWAKVGDTWGVRALGATTGDVVSVKTKDGRVSDVRLGKALGNDTFAPHVDEVKLADGTYEIEEDGVLVKYKVQTSQAGRQYAKRKIEGGWKYEAQEPLKRIAEGAELMVTLTGERDELLAGFRKRFGIGKTANVALPSSGRNDLAFWNLTTKNVYLTVGGQGKTTQPVGTQTSVLKRLAEMSDEDVQFAMVVYGQQIGACGRCGTELTDEYSREIGIGPECAKKGV